MRPQNTNNVIYEAVWTRLITETMDEMGNVIYEAVWTRLITETMDEMGNVIYEAVWTRLITETMDEMGAILICHIQQNSKFICTQKVVGCYLFILDRNIVIICFSHNSICQLPVHTGL